MLRFLAMITGVTFIFFGALGFFPAFVTNGELFSLFRVNFEHNVLHIGTGIIAVLCGLANVRAAKIYFLLTGFAYSIIAILGFMLGEGMLFQMFAINTADNYLHAIIAFVFLILGLKY